MDQRRRLVGQHVRLGALRKADVDLLVSWAEDTTSARLGDSGPARPQSEAAQRGFWERRMVNDDLVEFAIRLTDEDETLVGTVALGQIEWSNRVAEMGIDLPDPRSWGRGYGTEAVELMVQFAFDDMNLHRIQLGVFDFNSRAIACYERVGFTREGVYREYLQRDGRRHDLVLFGLLEPEWRSNRG